MHASTCGRLVYLLFGLFSLCPAAWTQPQLPDTPAGRRVAAYVQAFNAGESAMREFILNGWAADALKATPLSARVDRYRQIREGLGSISVYRVLEATEQSITAVFRSEKEGWMEFRFGFDESPQPLIAWLSIQQTDNPDAPPVARASSLAELAQRTTAYLDSLTRLDQFSGVVLVAVRDSTILHRAWGYADRANTIPNRAETRFNVGSINKVFTRIAILQLAAQGKLSLNDTIGRFLPDYPNADAARNVTVNHLITMSSGIGDFFNERYAAADKEMIRTLEDYLPLFADKPLEFSPGTGRRYSNGGYIVLGLIVARASGMDYFDYIRTHVYSPAGMSASDWLFKADLPADVARGYTSAERTSNSPTLPGRGSSAGGGYCTAGDLLRFVRALQNGTLILPDIQNGLGIAGGAPGLNAALEWNPASGVVTIVMCNLDPPIAGRVAQHIMKSLPAGS